MHAPYCFLIDADPDDPKSSREVDEYLNTETDVNNWNQKKLVVHQDGSIYQLEGDSQGGYSWYEDYAKIHKEERWEKVLKLAEKCVRYEITDAVRLVLDDQKYEVPDNMPYSEISKYLRGILIEALNKELESYLFWLAVENIARVAMQVKSIDNIPPFTTKWENPSYSIRAIDMRKDDRQGNYRKDKLAIVLVDIHT